MFHCFLLFHLLFLAHSYEKLPGYKNDVDPQLLYDGENMKFGIGTVKDSYSAVPYLQIPTGDGLHLRVPKAFYHYSERDVETESDWGIPDDGSLLRLNSQFKNNRKDINGIYLPLPDMQPINLHFISQRKFEKGIDTSAHDSSPEGALAAAKRLCLLGSESDCETALLRYHRKKVLSFQQQGKPLHQQLLNLTGLVPIFRPLKDGRLGEPGVRGSMPCVLHGPPTARHAFYATHENQGDLTSYSAVTDREGRGMGVVIGMPGYEPLYVGAALDLNKDGNLRFQFSPPE